MNTLTRKEQEVYKLILKGYSNSSISEELKVSINTTKTHVSHILSKKDAKTRVDLIVRAEMEKMSS